MAGTQKYLYSLPPSYLSPFPPYSPHHAIIKCLKMKAWAWDPLLTMAGKPNSNKWTKKHRAAFSGQQQTLHSISQILSTRNSDHPRFSLSSRSSPCLSTLCPERPWGHIRSVRCLWWGRLKKITSFLVNIWFRRWLGSALLQPSLMAQGILKSGFHTSLCSLTAGIYPQGLS